MSCLFVRPVTYAILYHIFKFVDIINAFHQHDTQIFISFYNNSLFVIYQTLSIFEGIIFGVLTVSDENVCVGS